MDPSEIKYSKYTEHIEANFLKNIRISSLGEKVAIPIRRVQQYFSMRKPYFVVSKIESNKLLKVSLEVKICLLEIPWKYQLQYAGAHSLRNTSCWSHYHFKGKNYSNFFKQSIGSINTNELRGLQEMQCHSLVWTSKMMTTCVNMG